MAAVPPVVSDYSGMAQTLCQQVLSELLRKLERLVLDVDIILHKVKRLERAGSSDVTFGRFEKDYRQAVAKKFDTMELFGADIRAESKRHSLSVAYVSLHVQRKATGATGSSRRDSSNSISMPVESVLDDISNSSGRMLIRGEAGSGKSTLFRWIAVKTASHLAFDSGLTESQWEELLDETEIGESKSVPQGEGERRRKTRKITASKSNHIIDKSWQRRVPFLIRLRDCEKGRLPSPETFPAIITRELNTPPNRWVTSVLERGAGIILLDGIDEVPGSDRNSLREDIVAIIDAYPKNLFLISTRPQAVPENWLEREKFIEARINPMSPVDRAQFIVRWHEAVARELDAMGRPENLMELANDLVDALKNYPEISLLATNPLLCAMICALHRDRNKQLPRDQSDLCESLCHMLLERREDESHLNSLVAPVAYRRLGYKQKRLIVQTLAYQMVLRGQSTVSNEVATSKIAGVLERFPNSSSDDAQVVLTGLIERSGMLREAKPGVVDFIHNTFKEFLAAETFAQENDYELLSTHALEADWQPVLVFSVITPKPNFADMLISKILDEAELSVQKVTQQDSYSTYKELHAKQLLALRCKNMALQLSPALIQRVDALVGRLFPPESLADAEALATLGDLAVEHLRYKQRGAVHKILACIHALNLIGTRKAKIQLENYRHDLREPVYTELTRAINPLRIDAVKAMLGKGEPLPPGIANQIVDTSPIDSSFNCKWLNLTGVEAEDFTSIKHLTSLNTLILAGTKISDLEPVSKLYLLEWLDIRNTRVTSIDALRNLTNLKGLLLDGCKVVSIASITKLTALENIGLARTRVEDYSPLKLLNNLVDINISEKHCGNLSLRGLVGRRISFK